jgi:hypothetical protein
MTPVSRTQKLLPGADHWISTALHEFPDLSGAAMLLLLLAALVFGP